uniref:Putative secreted protein n=1 Tax=Ixodes ricinus TaxID=34613 RepID=V5H603_IXORI
MPKTGCSFSMTKNRRMIAVLLVLFLHSLQITSAGDPPIEGDFSNLPPKCEEKAKKYIKETIPGLLKANVQPSQLRILLRT